MIAISEIITSSDLYWLTRLDSIRDGCEALAGLCGVATAAILIFTLLCSAEPWGEADRPKRHRWLWLTVPLFVLAVVARTMVPTTREAIAILVIPKIANNEDIQGLGADTIKVAREWLEELRPAAAKDGAK